MDTLTFRVEETKTGVPLELPVTRQLAAIPERRRPTAAARDSRMGVPVADQCRRLGAGPASFVRRISKAGGARFWFHGLRNASSPSPSVNWCFRPR